MLYEVITIQSAAAHQYPLHLLRCYRYLPVCQLTDHLLHHWSSGCRITSYNVCYTKLLRMIPRGGFKVSAGRSITKEELQEIINKYKLTSNDITDEFESKIGSIS